MRPPSCALLCDWVKSSWQSVSTDMIKNSFKSRAITTAIDGSEDSEIHCFWPQQPCAEGSSLFQQETTKLSQAQSVISGDPFGNDEDEEETYANEVIVDSDMGSASEEDSE